uniref:alcohol dehydrogenase n=1 Tax=Gossypium raimondii TaxID=29730 RepID=A0A0D2SM01_GOSRA|nr:hypothetical protein B456_010G038400 [Gossypium raimondii]
MEKQNRSGTAGKVIRCKAAVCRNPGEPLVIEEIMVDPPKAWEIRIKILCTSLCHSDVTFWKISIGPFALFPRIFGHEAVGVVESVGEHVEEFQEGDMVVPVFRPNCRECRDCKSQKGNGCSIFGDKLVAEMPRDGTSRFKGMNGETLHHFLSVSSFSEYTVVDVVHVVKISSEFPAEKACLLSCGVSTGIGAAWKVADIEEGSTVAIFGLGAVGLAVAEGARLRGASKIIGVDLNQEKFEIGKKFGVMILGVEMHHTPLPINTYFLLRGRTVTGCFFGGLKAKSDIPILAQKYLHKEINLDGFITHEVNFQDINKAFDLLLEGKSLRCIIWMD